jgi:hypothetical protein
MAHSTMQQYDPSLWFPTLQHGEYNDYPEGNVDNSSPLDGPNQLTNAGYPGEFGCPLSGQDEPLSNTFNSGIDSNSISLLVDQQNYDQFSFMNQPVAPTTRAPTSSSSISSGGEPYGYLPGFMYPGSQQIPHTVSNNAMHMHGHDQQNLHIYAQGYEDSSIIANDPNTPRLPDYFYRN